MSLRTGIRLIITRRSIASGSTPTGSKANVQITPAKILPAESSNKNLPSVETFRPEREVLPAYFTSDVPEELLTKRRVKIFRPTKNAMQSGVNETVKWQLDFDSEQKWTNPLMGWASSADAVQALRLRFNSKEDAIQFAEKQGWDYVLQKEQLPGFHKKSYGDNFKFSPGKLRLVRTK